MATVYSSIGKYSGSMGNVTFHRSGKKVVMTEKVQHKGTKIFTLRQANRVMRTANVVALWKSFGSKLRPSFGETSRSKQFARFMKSNLRESGLYLTNDEAARGACVVNNYVLSEGPLKSISVTLDAEHKAKTDISLGTGFTIDDDTTVAEFSEAVITNNGDRFKDGDRISVYYAAQAEADGVQKVKMTATQVELDTEDSTTALLDVVNPELVASVSGFLGSTVAVTGGIAYIASRREDTSTLCSPQRFVCNNATVVAAYSSRSKMKAAAKSYGKLVEDDYLTPTGDDTELPVDPTV